MLDEIDRFFLQDCRFGKGRPIVAGISGGPDSLCLLDILRRLGYPVIVAHLNHGLRAAAEGEARHLKNTVQGWGLPFVLGTEDVPAFAREKRLSLEEAARILRYRFLFTQAREAQAQAVAVGHTLDDQAETILLHLVRGSGLDGLVGMLPFTYAEWDPTIPLVRPLLPYRRDQILAYCRDQDLSPTFDDSNQNPAYLRNRVRHELMPTLSQYNPRIREGLGRLAQTLADDRAALEGVVQEKWDHLAISASPFEVLLRLDGFREQNPAVQRRLLRKAYAWLVPGRRELNFETVERVRRFSKDLDRLAGADLVGGVRLVVEQNRLCLGLAHKTEDPAQYSPPQLPGGIPIQIDQPGRYSLGGGWSLLVEVHPGSTLDPLQDIQKSDPYQAWMDAEALGFPLILRSRRAGDRFQPFGLHGHSLKLSDFMINEKMPSHYRQDWPLICREERIAWIPGYRPAEPFRITPETHTRLQFSLCMDLP